VALQHEHSVAMAQKKRMILGEAAGIEQQPVVDLVESLTSSLCSSVFADSIALVTLKG